MIDVVSMAKKKKRGVAHRKKAISVSGPAYHYMSDRIGNIGGTVDRLICETLDDPFAAARIVERIKRREVNWPS